MSENMSPKKILLKMSLNTLEIHPRTSNLLQYSECFSGVTDIITGASSGEKKNMARREAESKLLGYSGYNFPQVNHSHMPAFAVGPLAKEVICVNGGGEMHSGGKFQGSPFLANPIDC